MAPLYFPRHLSGEPAPWFGPDQRLSGLMLREYDGLTSELISEKGATNSWHLRDLHLCQLCSWYPWCISALDTPGQTAALALYFSTSQSGKLASWLVPSCLGQYSRFPWISGCLGSYQIGLGFYQRGEVVICKTSTSPCFTESV